MSCANSDHTYKRRSFGQVLADLFKRTPDSKTTMSEVAANTKRLHNLDEHITCFMCLEIANDAVELECCHGILCEACLAQLTTCPNCRHSEITARPSVPIRRIINGFPIVCECGYQTTRGELSAHKPKCPHGQVECMFSSCEYIGKRKEFFRHIAESHQDEVLQQYARTV